MKVFLRVIGILLTVVIGGYFIAELAATAYFKKSLDEEIEELSKYAEIDYEGFRFRLLHRDYLMSDVTAKLKGTNAVVLLDDVKATCTDFDIDLQTVKDLQVNVTGIRFHQAIGETGETESMFKATGYEDPRMDMNLDYNFEPETKLLTIRHLNLGHKEIGKLEFQMKLAGVQAVDTSQLSLQSIQPVLMDLVSKLTFHSGEIHYKDHGYTSRMIAVQAEKAGMSEEEFVDMAVERMDLLKYLRLPDDALQTLQGFMREPDKIRIVADPPTPVNSLVLIGGTVLGASPADIFGLRFSN